MIDLEYELRFSLASKTLRVHSIEDVSGSEEVLTPRRNAPKTVFQFVDKLDTFPVKVPLSRPFLDINEIEHELIYCEVTIGNAIYAVEDYALSFPPPAEYDTFITTPGGSGSAGGSGMTAVSESDRGGCAYNGSSSEVEQDCLDEHCVRESYPAQVPALQNLNAKDAYYVIRERSKIRPLFRVKFEYDHTLESSDDKLCESCYAECSVCFCYAERAQLCAKCDSQMHHNELTRRHQRHYFNEEATKFMLCALHLQIVDFWCVECETPVCTHCKIKGSHSVLPDHSLIPYKEAWSLNLEKLREDRSIDRYIEELEINLCEYQNSYEDFVERVNELKKIIREEYYSTISMIDQLQSKNYKTICKRYLEKRADLDKLLRMKSFRPNNFLSFFRAMREQRRGIKLDLSPVEIVEPINVTGGFKVNAKEISKREGVRPRRKSSDFYFESIE